MIARVNCLFFEPLEAAGLSSLDGLHPHVQPPLTTSKKEERKGKGKERKGRGNRKKEKDNKGDRKNQQTMGFDPFSLLKRLQVFESSVDGDGYPPSSINGALDPKSDPDSSNNNNNNNGGANSNANPTRPNGINDPSKTEGSAVNPPATHEPNWSDEPDPEEPHPGSNPSDDPGIPGIENPVTSVGEPGSGGGQTSLSTAESTRTADPSGGNGTFLHPGIDPVATSSASSAEEPTDSGDGMASSSGSGGGADGKKVAAIAVPVIVVCLALIAGLFFFMWRRRKRQAAQASGYHVETSNPDMTQNNPADTSQTRMAPLPVSTVPTMRYDPAETTGSSPQEPPQNTNNQRLSAVSVQLQRPPQPAVVENRPKSQVKRNSVTQGSTALTEENLATLGDKPEGYGYQRPRSPFEHPDDDAVSAISGLSPDGNNPHHQGRDADEVSAISSLENTEMPQRRP